jgi:methionine-rich copper-binding protein CopC
VIALAPLPALAHAVLVESTPAAHATLKDHALEVHLKFNSRIDGGRSRLYLVHADGRAEPLPLVPQTDPDSLEAKSITLDAGSYRIRWQVLAADGHITRGEVAFTVQ